MYSTSQSNIIKTSILFVLSEMKYYEMGVTGDIKVKNKIRIPCGDC